MNKCLMKFSKMWGMITIPRISQKLLSILKNSEEVVFRVREISLKKDYLVEFS